MTAAMKAHDLIERHGKRYAYRPTPQGNKLALLFVLFHKRVCGPLGSIHRLKYNSNPPPGSRPPVAKLITPFNAFSISAPPDHVRQKSSDQELKNLPAKHSSSRRKILSNEAVLHLAVISGGLGQLTNANKSFGQERRRPRQILRQIFC
jgi:hypothetical protein